MEAKKTESPDWYDLLEEAVKDPGAVQNAYKAFHKYSLGNRWLAALQLRRQGLPIQPINTFKGWLEAKRPVKKGEKSAISLVMPVPIKKTKEKDGEEVQEVFNIFVLRRNWFHLGQTDGEAFEQTPLDADWLLESALSTLGIQEVPFEYATINADELGWAAGRKIAVAPLDEFPMVGRLRQMARIVLGHAAEVGSKEARGVPDDLEMQRIEAETTAYLAAASLGLSGLEVCRGNIQDVLKHQRIPDKVAQRAFSAADKLLNAGYC